VRAAASLGQPPLQRPAATLAQGAERAAAAAQGEGGVGAGALDEDGDGALSLDEIEAALAGGRERRHGSAGDGFTARAAADYHDADADGVVTVEEFAAGAARLAVAEHEYAALGNADREGQRGGGGGGEEAGGEGEGEGGGEGEYDDEGDGEEDEGGGEEAGGGGQRRRGPKRCHAHEDCDTSPDGDEFCHRAGPRLTVCAPCKECENPHDSATGTCPRHCKKVEL
jgi:hypothetical protein